ncbi:hypothetical protein M758_UG301700 [Ceratodon purpureus]|nr:hypothetical protein M758_UG301700 [Ceratodon purpureus]
MTCGQLIQFQILFWVLMTMSPNPVYTLQNLRLLGTLPSNNGLRHIRFFSLSC